MLNNCTHAAANLIARDTCFSAFMPSPTALASTAGLFLLALLGTAYAAHLARKYFF